ncbi:gliding motility-associated C-terminal domain-containing protein [Flavobacterium hauense]
MKQKNKLPLKAFLCLLLALLCNAIYAQLSSFNLTATPTPQTCLGNGALSFTVTGATAGAAIEFEVYLLPNTSQPVTTVTTLTATGLVSGNYSVVATQSLNGQSNSATATATIADDTIPFAYTTTIVNANCQQGGSITVSITSGTASAYEIISGPQTFPQQVSNVFNGLQAGQYQLRVYDSCGDALVTTVTITQPAAAITINEPNSSQGALASCNTIGINCVFFSQSGADIAFPVTIQYTVHPPGGGAPAVINDAMAEGFISNYVVKEIPFYQGAYLYDIKITDACGNIFEKTDNIISAQFAFSLNKSTIACNEFYINMTAYNYVLPLTVSFISAPAGFNPSSFNASHPVINNPYVGYGDPDNPMPLGTYVIKITDACGHTAQNSIVLEEGGSPYVFINQSSNCFTLITISMPNTRDIATAVLTAAPASFGTVPQNMMSHVNGYTLSLDGVTPGNYTFEFTDECGNSYSVPVVVTSDIDPAIYTQQAMGCTSGFGSIMMYVAGKPLTSVKITAAPEAYTAPLPSDISYNIVDGTMHMNMLPGGTYSFEVVDECGNIRVGTTDIIPYIQEDDPADVIFNCGSFDIDLHNGNPQDMNAYYWLQKFDEASGQWIHPQNGIPNAGIWLENEAINSNFTYTGNFRIIKKGYSYNNGSEASGSSECSSELLTFTFTGAPVIEGAYAFPCTNGLSEVIIDAVGLPPLEYAITEKNGQPFVINNGPNMTFMSLENAVYNFSVSDECGNIVNIQYDITNLQPLEINQKGFCDGTENSLYVKSYTFLTYEWWKEGAPDVILSTTNKLDFPPFEPGQLGVYYLKIVSTTPGSCIDMVLEHTIEQPQAANAGDDNHIIHCDRSPTINLKDYLSGDHVPGGKWSEFEPTGHLVNGVFLVEGVAPGMYIFIYRVTACDITDEAVISLDVKGNDVFDIDIAEGCVDYSYTLSIININDMQGAEIAWTGPGNFLATQAVVAVSETGKYTATVTNAEGCIAEASVMVNDVSCDIPRGISPNGDGMNDYFDLSLMDVESIKIFNRYGLMIYDARNYEKEWHGQTNSGGELPTGTYYYMITLSGGKQVTGWVYLQREE